MLNPDPNFNGYLTLEQALADYTYLLNYIKTSIKGAENAPVISFGGSYGGMLAAWFCVKYPYIIAGYDFLLPNGHIRPKWDVNPNLRVLGQDTFPLKALSIDFPL